MPAPECQCKRHVRGQATFIICPLHLAAPELYAALERAIPDLEEYWRKTLAGSPATLQMAHEALAKARGEQPPALQSGSTRTAQEAVEQLEHVSVNRDEKPARYSDCTACGHLKPHYDFRATECRKCGRFVYLPIGSIFTYDRRSDDAQR